MTIEAGDLLKIDQDLSKVTQSALDYYIIMAKSGNPPVAITMANALKKGIIQYISTAGGTENLDCSIYDQFVITATTSTTLNLNLQNVIDGDARPKIIVKRADPDNQSLTFSGVTVGTSDVGYKTGKATMRFEVFSADGIISVREFNQKETGSLELADLAIDYGSITNFEFFNWDINGNICTIEAYFGINLLSTRDEYNITLSNFNITQYNAKVAIGNMSDSAIFNAEIQLTGSDNLYIRVVPAPTIGGYIPLTITQSFRIK